MVGPALGFLGLLIVGIVVFLGTQALLEVANDSKFKGANYEILGKLLWGKKGENTIVILLTICAISVFMGGVLFTIDFLDFAFCSHGVENLCHSKTNYLIAAFIISIVIALVENLKVFGYLSIISTFFIILSIFSISFYNLGFLFDTDIDITSRVTQFKPEGFLSFLGIALYTTEGICLVLPVR